MSITKNTAESHDSFGGSGISQEEAVKQLGDEGRAKVEAYRKNPNPETYLGYLETTARFKSLVTGEPYVQPVKHHDIPMSDIYMKHNQSRNMNFYVGILSRFKRKCLWSIPTLQVGVDKATYYFGYHPEFYKYYPIESCLFFLQHEAHHILQNHIPRVMKMYNTMRPVDEKNPTKRELEALQKLQTYTNIAADEAVNSILNHNGAFHSMDKSGFVTPSDYGHDELWSYDEYLNSWLLDAYSLFQKKTDGSGSSGMGSGASSMEKAMNSDSNGSGEGSGESGNGEESLESQIDRDFKDTTGSNGHTWIDDIKSGKSSEPTDAEKEKIAQAQKEAAEKGIPYDASTEGDTRREPTASELNDLADSLEKQGERVLIETVRDQSERGGRGTIPGNYLEKYEELTAVVEMHWTEIFHSMVADPKDAKETFRINKYNRNNALLSKANQYGFKEDDPKYRIWVSIDTSYSMNKDDIEEGLAVIQGILKSDSEIAVTICEFDTQIHRITELEADSEPLKDVWGRGGTDFNCIFKHLSTEVSEEERPDIHIIFTDGGAPPPQEDVRIPVHQMPLLWVLTSRYPDTWFEDGYGDILKINS